MIEKTKRSKLLYKENVEEIIEYILNLDLNTIRSPEDLNNVYKEIKHKETTICLSKEANQKIEIILKKSSEEQIFEFFKNLNKQRLIKTPTGSFLLETILKIFSEKEKNIYKKEIVKIFYESTIKDDIKEIFKDKFGTFVLREFFKAAKNYKKITKQLRELDFFKMLKFKEILEKIKSDEKFTVKKTTLVTTSIFITEINDSQYFLSQFLEGLSPNVLKNKAISFIYESIIEESDQENLDLFFSKIEDEFLNLCNHPISNFVLQKYIKKDLKNFKNIYKILKPEIESFEPNSNIVLSLIIAAQTIEEYTSAQSLIKKVYKDPFVFIFRGNTIDTKYYILFDNLLRSPQKLSFDAKKEFIKRFDPDWVFQKNSHQIVLTFIKQKNPDFNIVFDKIKPNFKRMSRNKFGRIVLLKIKNYCNFSESKKILNILESENNIQNK